MFGKGFPKYTFENVCQESSDLHLDDGAIKVFINAKSTIPDMSPELQGFLRYLCGDNPNTPLTNRIQNEVVKSRNNVRWERVYMLLEDKFKAYFAEGRAEGRIDTILEMFESGYLPLEVVLKETGTATEAELQAFVEERKKAEDCPMQNN